MVDFHTPTSSLLSHGKMFGKISENLTNVNTDGFKANNSVFHDIQVRTARLQGEADIRTMGAMRETGFPLDVAIRTPEGMFALGEPLSRDTDVGELRHFTRDGHFEAALSQDDDDEFNLLHSASGRVALGYPVGTENPTDAILEPIDIDQSIEVDGEELPLIRLEITDAGVVQATYARNDGATGGNIVEVATLAVQNIKEYQVGERPEYNVYVLNSEAHGDRQFLTGTDIMIPEYVEGSNVRVEEMMTALIQTQRTYQTISKTIVTQDEMLQTLNSIA